MSSNKKEASLFFSSFILFLDMTFHVHTVTEDPNHMNPCGGETVKHHMTVNMVLAIPLANIIAVYPDLGVIDNNGYSF